MDDDALQPKLSGDDIEAIARRVRELIREEAAPPRYIDATTLARHLGVERSWVYTHARELGAIRLGHGARARLRFDLAQATEAIRPRDRCSASRRGAARRSRRRRRRPLAVAELLPVRGEPPLSIGER